MIPKLIELRLGISVMLHPVEFPEAVVWPSWFSELSPQHLTLKLLNTTQLKLDPEHKPKEANVNF